MAGQVPLPVLGALSPKQRLGFTMGQVEQTLSLFQLWDPEELFSGK